MVPPLIAQLLRLIEGASGRGRRHRLIGIPEHFQRRHLTAAVVGKIIITGIEVQGHTDSHGGDAYNQGLSQRRADAVRLYLIEKGIAADRLTARGYGKAQPIATNDTAQGRSANRRVEFKLGGAGDTVSNR